MAGESDDIIRDILNREGDEYTNRPNDRGGPTKYGITQRTLSRYRGRPVTPADVEALTRGEAYQIYLDMYVNEPKFDHIDDKRLRGLMEDAGVQHGPVRVVKWLQRAANVKDDGLLGPISLAAIDADNPVKLYLRVLATRIRFYGSIISNDHTQAANAAGWMNRVTIFVEDKTLWEKES